MQGCALLHMARHESGRIAPRFQRSRDAATKFAFQPRSLWSRGLHAHFVARSDVNRSSREQAPDLIYLHPHSAFIKKCLTTRELCSRISTVRESEQMREWLSGGVSPCQGEGRGFESRLALLKIPQKSLDKHV